MLKPRWAITSRLGRHAFDADHISAIDNTARKLMSDGKRPLGTGFFFALGHSTAIVVVGFGLGIAAKAVFGAVVDPNSGYEPVGGVMGTSMAAGFLYLIAALNAVVLAGIVNVVSGLRAGRLDEAELERQLQARGMQNAPRAAGTHNPVRASLGSHRRVLAAPGLSSAGARRVPVMARACADMVNLWPGLG